MRNTSFLRSNRRKLAACVVTAIAGNLVAFASSGAQTPTSTVSPVPTPAGQQGPSVTQSVTDTEYISVRMDANGRPLDLDVKEWYRVRRAGGGRAEFLDPGVLDSVKGLGGGRPDVEDNGMRVAVDVPSSGFADVYIAGEPIPGEDGTWKTAAGPRPLPIDVSIRYYTGEPGSEEATKQVNAAEFSRHHGPFKLVVTVKNNTKRTEEVTYNDVQTKKEMTAVAEVFTPFSVSIPNLVLPDEDFDSLRSNGTLGRDGGSTVINWTLFLAPPDYPEEQHAIVEGRINGPKVPKIDVVAQPVYPEPVAEALTSAETQFQKGRRSFYYDVFNLFRESLIALGGLFSVLDDSFSNLALPLIGPEKGNRDSGSFTDANLLWGVWTIAKGTEQLSRAINDIDYTIQLARDGIKGQIATTQTFRLLLGKSTDTGVFAGGEIPLCPTCVTPEDQNAYYMSKVNALLGESIWANLKDLEYLLGGTETARDPRPYLPEAPSSAIATNPGAAVMMSVIKLKIAILEHDLYCLVYENHENECSTMIGVSYKPNAQGWDKWAFVKFPFGQIEVEKGLHQLELEGTDQIQAALGNKVAHNSFVWGTKTIVEGIEALVDSFAQLGATWRYIADSVQNFGIFGVETSRSILQLDINAIDIKTAAKAAASRRALQAATFFGKPEKSQGQLVLSFSTDPDPVDARSSGQKTAAGIGLGLLLLVGLMFARLKLYWI